MRFVLFTLLLLCCNGSAQLSCKVTQVKGCFHDSADSRVFPVQAPAVKLTQESCAASCYVLNYTYSGVEYGSQCFCGNEFRYTNPAPASDCNMKCPDNAGETCGSADRIYVYESECSGNSAPNYHGCLSDTAKQQPYCDTSKPHAERLASLMGAFTLEEKMSVISADDKLGNTCNCHTGGVDRLGLPSYMWLVETNTAVASACLGPGKCGVVFNGPLGLGASFNRSSWRLKGEVVGREMRAFSNLNWHRGTGPNDFIALTGYGPNINVARDPRFGRTSELPGEDPFLNGEYATEYVQGMQTPDKNGHPLMLAYLKHLTAYSTESNRGHDSYTISPHDLFETYLPQYERAFTKGQATGAMCSYNAINGHPSCANNYVLNQVVREKWGRADAHVTTDCGAVANLRGPPVNAPTDAYAVAMALNNGTDIEMGGTLFKGNLAAALSQGLISEETLNTAVNRSLFHLFKAGRFDPVDSIEWTQIGMEAINSTYHQQVQAEAAAQSFVLLKNTDNTLPLRAGMHVAVLGPMGHTRLGLLSDYAGDQQCWEPDGGCIRTIYEGVAAANVGGTTTGSKGVDVNSNSTAGWHDAIALAKAADVVVLVMGNDKTQEHEGIDRQNITLPGLQEPFAQAVVAIGKPVVLVLSNGGPIAIPTLMDSPKAIVEVFNPGVGGAVPLGKTLFGALNNWGRLPYTIYQADYVDKQSMTNYDMAKAPGRTYKYYQDKPLFAFGDGLSYTSFTMDLEQRAHMDFTVRLKNEKNIAGDEVVMVFHSVDSKIRADADHPIPIKELVGFDRVSVPVNGVREMHFTFTQDSLSLVNKEGDRVVYSGTHYLTFSQGNGKEQTATIEIH